VQILIFILLYAAAGAMTLMCIGMLFWRVPKMFSSSISKRQQEHDALLLFGYLLFPLHVVVIVLAIGGTFGDGATSTMKYVSLTTQRMVPILQIGAFLLWAFLRLSVQSLQSSQAPSVLYALPGLIPASAVLILIFTRL
jgi:hypothetical protein